MGSLYKKGHVLSYIVIFLTFVSLLISVPIKKAFVSAVDKKINKFRESFYEKTGILFSYESVSPSILSNFYIKKIKIVDSSKSELLSVDKTRVNFKLFKLIKGDFQDGISSVVVDGIDADLSKVINFIKKIEKNSSSGSFEMKKIRQKVPENIKLKNIKLSYSEQLYDCVLSVKNISVNNKIASRITKVDVESSVQLTLKNYKKTILGKLDLNGDIMEELDNSQVNVKLRNFSDGEYKIPKLNLHASYSDRSVEIHSIQAVNPISVGISYNFDTTDANVQLRTEKLNPVSMISVFSKQKEIAKFKDVRLDTNTILTSNLTDKTVNFRSNTGIFLPPAVFPDGANVSFSAYGDEKSFELEKLSVKGKRCNASAKLSLIYKALQLSGLIEISDFVLDNGKSISTEIYFDPKDSGFIAFSPQLFIGSRALTAIQLSVVPQSDSYDFALEAYDYSKSKESGGSEHGVVKIDGSYLLSSNYFQTSASLNSIYLDSVADIAAQFFNENLSSKIESFRSTLSPYMLSGDMYLMTDLKTYSYNVPYVLLANTQKDNQVFMFSVNGSDQRVQLNQLSVVYGKYALNASASLDFNPETHDAFFLADLNAGSIPYHFSGTFMPEVVTITGDYGTDVEVRLAQKKDKDVISGHVSFENLPLKILENSLVLSTRSNFSYDNENGPQIQLQQFQVEGTGSNVSVNPKAVLTGNITKYGAQLNSISYTDLYSTLEGNADFIINFNQDVFDSVGVVLKLNNPIKEESIAVDGSLSNPDGVGLNAETLMKNIYMNFQVLLKNFSLNRFANQQNDNNLLTASLYASGTVEHPYAALSVDNASVIIASDKLTGNGNIVLEDRDISIDDVDIDFGNLKLDNIKANCSISEMTLEASCDASYNVYRDKIISAPVKLSANNAVKSEGKLLPDSISINLSAKEVGGNFIRKKFPISVSAIYNDKIFDINSSDNIGLSGQYTTDGILQLNLDNRDFITAKLDGFVTSETCNLELYDVNCDVQKVFAYTDFAKYFEIDRGILTGNIVVTGTIDNPELNGAAKISNPLLRLPMFTKQKLTANDIFATMENGELSIPDATLSIKSNQRLHTDWTIVMNKWSLDHIEGNIKTPEKDKFPIFYDNDGLTFEGDVSADLNIYYEDPVFKIAGRVVGEDVELTKQLINFNNTLASSSKTDVSELNYESSSAPSVLISCNLQVFLGTHASVRFDPLLRCVFVPNTQLRVVIDEENSTYAIDGALNLKSGDISYLNRSFYIKSGAIKFNKDDVTNPLVTLNAETRERDDKSRNVKIILSVENQYLLDLKPSFSSEPPKSEREIQSMLGQIVIADSANATNFLFAASDYAIQSTVMREFENGLRNMLNFDIFSIRTNILQNTYNMSVSGKFSEDDFKISNFLDNTTVYMGKYLGSSLYVDAMIHFSFEDSNFSKILFQPEFGMELESPNLFMPNVRVNVAPDLNALLKNQFVPSTTVSLSWKYTY